MPDSDMWLDAGLGASITSVLGLITHWAAGDAFISMSVGIGLILLASWCTEVGEHA